ncbi:MAG TPA: hypothetical protein VK364_11875, partial [Hymenobacter sp.]|nr:hypothetical protein [Hymenobacter sp.]
LFRYPALVPTMPWLDAVPPRPAQNLVLTASLPTNTLTWQPSPVAADGDQAVYYILYRFDENEAPTPNDPRRILAVVRPRPGTGLAFTDTTARLGRSYAYYLTAVDRLHNESRPVNVRSTGRPGEIVLAQASPETSSPTASAPVTTASVPTPRPSASRPTASAGTVTKVKTKTKTKKKRGFFARLFGKR